MKFGNCWLYALPRWLREGGYIVVCWSPRNTFVPHAMFTQDIQGVEVEEYVPINPRSGLVGVLSSVLFRGRVRRRRMPGPDETLTGIRP